MNENAFSVFFPFSFGGPGCQLTEALGKIVKMKIINRFSVLAPFKYSLNHRASRRLRSRRRHRLISCFGYLPTFHHSRWHNRSIDWMIVSALARPKLCEIYRLCLFCFNSFGQKKYSIQNNIKFAIFEHIPWAKPLGKDNK